jgi:hypothetical protein
MRALLSLCSSPSLPLLHPRSGPGLASWSNFDILLPPGGGFQPREERELRFAVHWPGIPVASPRIHGVPRRDVPGSVNVRVAGVSAGRAAEGGLALARPPVHVPARRAPLACKCRADLSTLPGALSSRRRDRRPHPEARMLRFSPAFWATFRPGAPAVPFVERVMPLMLRSSMRMTSNRRARSVESLSHQVPWRGAPAWLPPPMLFDRQIPHIPGIRTAPEQRGLLFGRRL